MNISSSDSIIQISGVDSAEFLQGQITNDINFASESKMTISAICNVKGRIIAVFKILKTGSGFLIFINNTAAKKFKNYLLFTGIWSNLFFSNYFFHVCFTSDSYVSKKRIFK